MSPLTHLDDYVRDLQLWGRKKETIDLYVLHLKKFFGSQPGDKLPDRNAILGFLAQLDVCDRTRASYRSSIRAYLFWLRDNGHVEFERNPATGLRRKFAKARPKFIPDRAEVLRRILAVPQADMHHMRNRVLILTIYSLGLRPGEAARLKTDDIDWNAATALIYATKTDTYRRIPIPAPVFAVLEWYQSFSRDGYLFPSHGRDRHQHVSPKFVGKCWRKYQRDMGIDPGEVMSLYALRHAFATHAHQDDGIGAFELKELMGHASITTTANYCRPHSEPCRARLDSGWFRATASTAA